VLTIEKSETPDIGTVFAALSDPTRRAIVARLSQSDANPLELAAPFSMSLPAISRHLKVLEQASIITRGRDGRHRPCQLRPESVAVVAQWAMFTREAWEQRLDRLDGFLKIENGTNHHQKEEDNE
jgi:DNA-binding transcriptional ArsR family regulator